MHVAVIPAYNEERSISGIVEEARKHVDYVVVVDDSSTDGTGDAARNSGAIVIENQKERGVGAAIITGIDYVKKLRPRVVV
ncbi:MAG: glycosyltransferase, partial [Candidatus Bathyarchaeia archaeon]